MVDLSLPTLALRLRSLQKHLAVSQAKLAAKAGITPQAMTKWLKGGEAKEANLRRLAEKAGVDFRDLRDGQQEPHRPDLTTQQGREAWRLQLAMNTTNMGHWISYGEYLVSKQTGAPEAYIVPSEDARQLAADMEAGMRAELDLQNKRVVGNADKGGNVARPAGRAKSAKRQSRTTG